MWLNEATRQAFIYKTRLIDILVSMEQKRISCRAMAAEVRNRALNTLCEAFPEKHRSDFEDFIQQTLIMFPCNRDRIEHLAIGFGATYTPGLPQSVTLAVMMPVMRWDIRDQYIDQFVSQLKTHSQFLERIELLPNAKKPSERQL